MSTTTRLLGDSCEPTTTSVDKGIVIGTVVETQTNRNPCPVFQIDFSRSKQEEIPAGHLTIDEFVEQSEKDELRKTALEEARRWVAESFFPGQEDSIRTLRLRKGLSQSKLAALAHTTQAHIARIETGVSDCQVGTLQKVADALGLDVLVTIKAFLSTRNEAMKSSADE